MQSLLSSYIVKLGSWSMVLVKFKIHDHKRTRADAVIQMHPPTTPQLFNINIKVKDKKKNQK